MAGIARRLLIWRINRRLTGRNFIFGKTAIMTLPLLQGGLP
jgi:hypothetical protein